MSRVRRNPDSSKKIWIVIFVIASVFSLIFFSVRGRYSVPLGERTAVTFMAPLQEAVAKVGDEIRGLTAGIWEVVTVYHQNEMLKSEVEQLRTMNLQSQELASENERLRSMLGYKQTVKQFDLVAAEVISRDMATWTDMIIINRGKNDGVKKEMAVVTPQGLVGCVVEAYDSYSRVQLILDPRAAVGTIVQRMESRVAGIVEGNPGDKALARMVNIPKDADIIEGDLIVTSGFGGIYPKGIAVGKVERIENDDGGLLKCALLKPAVDFQRIEEVSVIVNSREPLPLPITPPPVQPATSAGATK